MCFGNKQLVVLAVCSLLCLSGCAKRFTCAPPPISQFFALGLSEVPYETAEEILVKAHARDAEAATLAVLGYSLGIGGFPENDMLAFSWLEPIAKMGARQNSAFLEAYLDRETIIPPEDIRLGEYLGGQKSIFAHRFKQAGLFDIDQRIKQIHSEAREQGEAWHEMQKESTRMYSFLEEVDEELRGMIEYFSYNPMTDEEAKRLTHIIAFDNINTKEKLLFYIQTSHNQNEGPPVFDDAKLLDYLAMRHKDNFFILRTESSQVLKNRLIFYSRYAQEIIRMAHAGDIAAIRHMARNYSTGDMNFIKNYGLSSVWLSIGAYAGDALCQLLYALDAYRMGNSPIRAWGWAKIAAESADEQISRIARLILEQIESEATFDLELARTFLHEYREDINK